MYPRTTTTDRMGNQWPPVSWIPQLVAFAFFLISVGCDSAGKQSVSQDANVHQRVDASMADLGHDARIADAWPDMSSNDGGVDGDVDGGSVAHHLLITEFMAKNEGAWVDEVGETDDWIELHNPTDGFIDLSQYEMADASGVRHRLPRILIEPREYRLFWADREEEQGAFHLPFKLSANGDALSLWHDTGRLQTIEYEFLGPNESLEITADGLWRRCRWASPGRSNPTICGAYSDGAASGNEVFDEYIWSDVWPQPPTPLIISEFKLAGNGFVEILNVGAEPVDLSTITVRVAPHSPGEAWPDIETGNLLTFGEKTVLAPGERGLMNLSVEAHQALEANQNEGVVTLWMEGRNFPLERLDFMAWPDGASLTRIPEQNGRHRFCAVETRGESNTACDPIEERIVPGRLRHIRTPGDFDALAEGGTAVGIDSVKFLVEVQAPGLVHLLGSSRWDLHYTFARETIEQLPHLDRCDPAERDAFRTGWVAFSEANYTEVEGRAYYLGTLVHYGSNGGWTVEFTGGDAIVSDQMRQAFFGVAGHMMNPKSFYLRPQTDRQVDELRQVEGQVPVVGRLTPFENITFQALTQTVGYGVLRYVPTSELDTVALGPQVIVLTNDVPNDVALTGGLITEAFQTPLAHVNLLSRNRNTPNMALRDARNHPRVAPFLDRLVRLEVSGADFSIELADPIDAEAFWASRRPDGPPIAPSLDTNVRNIHSLDEVAITDVGSVGAKAAQLAHLSRLGSHPDSQGTCAQDLATPLNPMAIPLIHALEHYEASGAQALLRELEEDPEFRGNPLHRSEGLRAIRQLITDHPVVPSLLAEVSAYVETNFGEVRVRFRSSSNTEDLANFNGAGLYTSVSAIPGDDARSIAHAIRTVWASLYLSRAYDERRYYNIDESRVAMGVLIHPAFISELANGVAISRNILQPIRDQEYINVQIGEASVANPAPGVKTEQIIYDGYRQPRLKILGRSSLTGGRPVLTDDEAQNVGCIVDRIESFFQRELDPEGANRWFAMDIEFKLIGAQRRLVVKQARQYSFGSSPQPADCREL